jgi:hypothetical protein
VIGVVQGGDLHINPQLQVWADLLSGGDHISFTSHRKSRLSTEHGRPQAIPPFDSHPFIQ